MNKTLATIGGIVGAIFTGLAVYMFNYKEVTYTTLYGIQIPSGEKTYPEIATVLLIIAMIGFVVMIIAMASKPKQ
jgi:cell division protein FtsX